MPALADNSPVPTTATAPATAATRVWDLPTRLFHWLLALAFVGSIVSAKMGGNAMVWHFRFGYSIFALLVFRVLWGLVGGRWSRFGSFIHAPGTTLRYLRGRLRPGEVVDIGHSPSGSVSVFVLLGLLALQVATGLVADDEIISVGPLNALVDSNTALAATSWHRQYGQWLLITLALVHVLVICWMLLRRRVNLVSPMLSGDKPLPTGTPASADGVPQRLLALVLIVLCAGLVRWVIRLGG